MHVENALKVLMVSVTHTVHFAPALGYEPSIKPSWFPHARRSQESWLHVGRGLPGVAQRDEVADGGRRGAPCGVREEVVGGGHGEGAARASRWHSGRRRRRGASLTGGGGAGHAT